MIFSVPLSSGYAYFEAPAVVPPTGWMRTPHGQPVRGMYPPEAFAEPLPAAAVARGKGERALGMIATRAGSLGGDEAATPSPWPRRLAWLAGGVGLGWLIGRK